MEWCDIACQRQPAGQCRGGRWQHVADTTDSLRAVACICFVLGVVVHRSEIGSEEGCAARDNDERDVLATDPMKCQCTEDDDGYDHNGRSHRDHIPESKRLLLVGGHPNTRGLRGMPPSLIRPPEQVDQSG